MNFQHCFVDFVCFTCFYCNSHLFFEKFCIQRFIANRNLETFCNFSSIFLLQMMRTVIYKWLAISRHFSMMHYNWPCLLLRTLKRNTWTLLSWCVLLLINDLQTPDCTVSHDIPGHAVLSWTENKTWCYASAIQQNIAI